MNIQFYVVEKRLVLYVLWCFTPLSIFQLYCGGQIDQWRKPEDPEKITDLSGKEFHNFIVKGKNDLRQFADDTSECDSHHYYGYYMILLLQQQLPNSQINMGETYYFQFQKNRSSFLEFRRSSTQFQKYKLSALE